MVLEPDCGSGRRASSIEFSAGALMAIGEQRERRGRGEDLSRY
jgi:hypothetical protein